MEKPIILTDQEQKIAHHLAQGHSYDQIADRLGVSVNTVRFHIKNLYRKLQVHNKIGVVTSVLRGEI